MAVKKCSFCGRPSNEVRNLIQAKSAPGEDEDKSPKICEGCVTQAMNSITNAKKGDIAVAPVKEEPLKKPKEITAHLDEYVVAQPKAKIDLAVAIYNHYKRRQAVKANKEKSDVEIVEIDKANILLLGPTGTGKTHLARSLARMLNVPFYVGDATRLTQAGYVGDDVESLLQGLIQDASGDIERAEWGIVYIDEIDKIARSSGRERGGYRDVSGEGVQQALLKLLEGSKVSVARSGGKNVSGMQASDTIDTTNILFICAGSFAGIEEGVRRRISPTGKVGFGAESKAKITDEEVYRKVTEDDILDFGIIPELKGRLPVLTSTYELSEQDMAKILVEPKNSIVKQAIALFALDGVELKFEDDAILEIARIAKKKPMGARGLRSILEKVLASLYYEVPSDSTIRCVTITRGAVTEESGPVILYQTPEETSEEVIEKNEATSS